MKGNLSHAAVGQLEESEALAGLHAAVALKHSNFLPVTGMSLVRVGGLDGFAGLVVKGMKEAVILEAG